MQPISRRKENESMKAIIKFIKNYTINKSILFSFALIFTLFSIGCEKEEEIIGNECQTVLTYADPITDRIMEGHNNLDYAKYSRDFDETMKNALTQPVFKQKQQLIFSKIGKYKSRTLTKVLKQSGYKVAIYSGEFENESNVVIRVVFQNYGENNLVAGLWLNSPKLRE